ncbi:MAG: ferredoxin-nitrite reductase [Verrucomicrobiales bacterium]|jgi:ferredoxin-nitrite reductase
MTVEASFTTTQKEYLSGFFVGAQSRGVSFKDLGGAASPAEDTTPAEVDDDDLCKEERIKREMEPLDSAVELFKKARTNAPPEGADVFRFKWNGLFWLSPVKDGYMCRLRIPGGVIHSFQIRELAKIADELTTGYIQITTRNNFQLRLIEPKDCPEVLRRVQSVGLHSKGAGADNIRNITMNPCAGYDPHEIIDVRPLVNELGALIIGGHEFFNLPRKFNIAFDGGGTISSVEDTNDIGASAVVIGENSEGIEGGTYFRFALGGVTGHKTFASDWGVVAKPEQVTDIMVAILQVFIRDGDRTNRKRSRLKYLIEKRGLPGFLVDVEEVLGYSLLRLPADSSAQLPREVSQQGHGHIGVHPQKQEGLNYIGAVVPVGQLTSHQLSCIANIAESYGNGEVRLTVWQNLIIPNIPTAFVESARNALRRIGLRTEQSPLRGGFVACTGNRYCKYAASDTKGHAIAMMDYLESRVPLDRPINVHFTGCPHSCAQHFMGDIGLLACAVKNTPSGEGYHITVGGGFGEARAIGRQIFQSVPYESLGAVLEATLRAYLDHRSSSNESFHAFCSRHATDQLQGIFAATEAAACV